MHFWDQLKALILSGNDDLEEEIQRMKCANKWLVVKIIFMCVTPI